MEDDREELMSDRAIGYLIAVEFSAVVWIALAVAVVLR